ncbi:MAG: GNAT family N-acetyltransferase [Pyrinomonadaceae bacterium]
MNLKIRQAALKDAATLARIGWQAFDEAFGEHPKNHPGDMKLYRAEYFSAARIETDLSEEKILYLVAETDEEMAGYAKIQFDSREDCLGNGKTIELCRLYALDKFIGKGVGKTLMLKFLKIGRKNDCDVAWLGVWEFNFRAQEFYKRFGFEKCGEHIFQLGSDPQIDWIMQKKI